jgi:membrane protein required for colicin V production
MALKFSFLAVKFLSNTVHISPKIRSVVAFVLVFLVVVLLVRLIAWGLEQILKDFSLNSVNKIVGGILQALVGLYILCVFIWFLNKWDVIPKSQKEDSYVYPYLSNLAPSVIEFSGTIVPYFKGTFNSFEELLDKQAASNS